MMDQQERELFEASLRQATANHTDGNLDAALDEVGWRDALEVDERAAISLLFELQGAAGATSSALDGVIARALAVDNASSMGVVLPPLGRTDPPGEVVAEGVAVRGLGTAHLRSCASALIVARAGQGDVAVVVDTSDLELRSVVGVDPVLGVVEVSGDAVGAATRPTTRSGSPPAGWPTAVAAGQVAIAHELVGASGAMLQLARDHAVERIQFGRPIASFQAVRHRLADGLVAIEAARAALDAAWDVGSPMAAAVAKAIAGRAARTVARQAQQVLAGIGFTTEHPLHRYVRRTMVLDRVLGDARSLTRQVGDDLLRTRTLPAILPL